MLSALKKIGSKVISSVEKLPKLSSKKKGSSPRRSRIGLRSKLVVAFLIVGLVPFFIVASLAYSTASSSLEKQAFSGLTAVGVGKQKQVVQFLRDQLMSVNVFAHEPMVKDSVIEFGGALSDHGLESTEYQVVEKRWASSLAQIVKRFRWADLYILDLDGNVVYSNKGNSDLGVNVNSDETVKNTDLAEAFQTAIGGGVLVGDLKYYEPLDQAVGFVSHRIFARGGSDVTGVLIAAYTADEISAMVQGDSGVGRTGVVKVIGQDHYLRSNISEEDTVRMSILDSDKHESTAIDSALNEGSGTDLITNEDGKKVLASWQPVIYRGARWAMVAEIDAAEALAPVRSLGQTLSFFGAGIMALILVIAWLTARSVVRPVITTVRELTSSAGYLEGAASEVAQTGHNFSEAAQAQAASLEEATTALEEVSGMATMASENASEANISADAAKASTDQGHGASDELDTAMSSINDSAGQITRITKVIQEIAFQTNLLALNAAIEAARAGEHGRGFAVVADEVRVLANKVTVAADEITDLIEGSVRNAKQGSETSDKVGHAFSDIAEHADKVANLVSDIESLSQEQKWGVETVTNYVTEIDKVTEDYASYAEEAATSGHRLYSEVQNIHGVIMSLEALVGTQKQAQRHRGPDNEPQALSVDDDLAPNPLGLPQSIEPDPSGEDEGTNDPVIDYSADQELAQFSQESVVDEEASSTHENSKEI